MRESFIFYGSFFEAIRELPPESQARCYDAIMRYVFGGEKTELSGIEKSILILIKPQLDANNTRYENGCKGGEFGKLGGRPTKTPKKPLNNPDGVIDTKPLNNPKRTPNENDNENVNDNENGKGGSVKGDDSPVARPQPKEIGCRFEKSDFYTGDIPEKLPDAYAEYANKRGFSEADAITEFQKFTSHWIGKTGKEAIKSRRGWLTAWASTWLANARRFRGDGPAKANGNGSGPSWGPGGCPQSVIDEFLGKKKSESEVPNERSV